MEEISLRELIEILLRGKWLIAVITALCVIVTGIFTFFIIDPQYEAQTMLMISPVSNTTSQDTDGNKFLELVGSFSQYPQMTVDTYREQVKAPVILDYIRTEMGLEESSLSSIADKITVNALEKTNLITISVKDTDPEKAAQMANLVSDKFTAFVSETNRKQAENSAKFIKEQMDKEKSNLDMAMEKLKDFLAKPRGPQELKSELDSKLNQLTEFKTQITQIKIDEETTRSALQQGKSILAGTPGTIITSKTIISDEFLASVIKDKTNLEIEDIAGIKLSDEQINEIYVAASQTVNDLEIQLSQLTTKRSNMEREIAARQKEIELLQAELADKQQEYDILNYDVEMIKQTYDAYQQRYKEAMIKQSADIGESSIIVVSRAITPINPVSPNKALNIAISFVLGIIVSVFIVFIREYWKNSGTFTGVSARG